MPNLGVLLLGQKNIIFFEAMLFCFHGSIQATYPAALKHYD